MTRRWSTLHGHSTQVEPDSCQHCRAQKQRCLRIARHPAGGPFCSRRHPLFGGRCGTPIADVSKHRLWHLAHDDTA